MKNLIKSQELRRKIMVLLLCLGVFKVGMHIYVPGIDRRALDGLADSGGMFSVMNTFTGGALSNFSIFAIGIMPYITASIIIQLLQMNVVPKLTEWKEQGAYGQAKVKNLTYVLTLFFAGIQALVLSFSFNKMYTGLVKDPSVMSFMLIAFVLTMGTVILVVLGEVIERKGIGKGISMIILAGILMMLPDNIAMYYDMTFIGEEEMFIPIVKTVLIVAFFVTITLAVIIVNGGERRVPIQSTGGSKYGMGQKSFMPFKINMAGVIPVIFASAMFMMPMTIIQMLGKEGSKITSYIGFDSYVGIILYALIIIMFTYFYAFVQMDPEKIAKNIQQNNSYVPTIRPGKDTETYFRNIVTRLTFVGSLFLAIVSVIPILLGKVVILPEQLMFGGTSIIIIVSVVVDLKNTLGVEMKKSSYQKYKENKSGTLWKVEPKKV